MTQPDIARTEKLGRVGSARCLLVTTDQPWTVPVEAYVVSVGGPLLGSFGQALMERFPQAAWDDVDLRAVTVEAPRVVGAGADPPWFICTTLQESSSGLLGKVGRAGTSLPRSLRPLTRLPRWAVGR